MPLYDLRVQCIIYVQCHAGQLESLATGSTASSSLPAEEGDSKGHSNSPTDSVALMVMVCSRSLQAKLEVACSGGVVDVFSTTGRHKTVFPVAYQEYSSELAKLEDNICRYLKVSLNVHVNAYILLV